MGGEFAEPGGSVGIAVEACGVPIRIHRLVYVVHRGMYLQDWIK